MVILISACQNKSRTGIHENNRQYVTAFPENNCSNSNSFSDFLFELNSLGYEEISKQVKMLSDSVLGADFLGDKELQNIDFKLKKQYFPFEQEITEMKLIIGNQNLWDLENGSSELENNKIVPRKLKWKKLVNENEPLKVFIDKKGLKIEIEIFHCMNKSVKQFGQFEKIIRHDSSLEQIPVYAYEIDFDFIISLNISDEKSNKHENYRKVLTDTCTGFSIGDYEKIQYLMEK